MSIEAKLESVSLQVMDEFSRTVLKGAQHALADKDNPLRANFFATAMRILFEHTQHALAPDEEVKACAWFKQEPGTEGPTRSQRVKYAIQGGLNPYFVANDLHVDVTPLSRRLKSAFQELGKHVHGRAETLISDPAKQELFMMEMMNDFSEMMNVYEDCRRQILAPIEESVSGEAVDALMQETIQSIDELATHHSIEEIYVDHTEVTAITHDQIVYTAKGTITVVLQWGSNSDLRNDNGAESERSFPFTCRIEVPIDDPHDLGNGETTYAVNTGNFYGADDEEYEAQYQSDEPVPEDSDV